MKEPDLILSTARSDVETLTRGVRRECLKLCVRRSHHTEKHNVTFVPLECVGIAAHDFAVFDFLGLKAFHEQ